MPDRKKAVFKVYSDAACFNNGRKNPELPMATAIGVTLTFNGKIIKQYSELFIDETVSFGELKAGITALEMIYARIKKIKASIVKPYKIIICSDSQYFIKGSNEWIKGWKKNKWRNYQGEVVAQCDMWQLLNENFLENQELDITFKHIRGHKIPKQLWNSFVTQFIDTDEPNNDFRHLSEDEFDMVMNENCDRLAGIEIQAWKEENNLK